LGRILSPNSWKFWLCYWFLDGFWSITLFIGIISATYWSQDPLILFYEVLFEEGPYSLFLEL